MSDAPRTIAIEKLPDGQILIKLWFCSGSSFAALELSELEAAQLGNILVKRYIDALTGPAAEK